jgi:hypothetical protein
MSLFVFIQFHILSVGVHSFTQHIRFLARRCFRGGGIGFIHMENEAYAGSLSPSALFMYRRDSHSVGGVFADRRFWIGGAACNDDIRGR